MTGRGQRAPWDKWYGTARWARIRRYQLLEHPLCKFCLERGIVTPATICDHVEPHHGDANRFWLGPFQSLCKGCHDSTKRFVETRGFRPDVGLAAERRGRAGRDQRGARPRGGLARSRVRTCPPDRCKGEPMARRQFSEEEARERHRAQVRAYQQRRRLAKRAGNVELQPRAPAIQDHRVDVEPPPEVLAERDQRMCLFHTSPTQALCGDPLPGYSALDRRSILLR